MPVQCLNSLGAGTQHSCSESHHPQLLQLRKSPFMEEERLDGGFGALKTQEKQAEKREMCSELCQCHKSCILTLISGVRRALTF